MFSERTKAVYHTPETGGIHGDSTHHKNRFQTASHYHETRTTRSWITYVRTQEKTEKSVPLTVTLPAWYLNAIELWKQRHETTVGNKNFLRLILYHGLMHSEIIHNYPPASAPRNPYHEMWKPQVTNLTMSHRLFEAVQRQKPKKISRRQWITDLLIYGFGHLVANDITIDAIIAQAT